MRTKKLTRQLKRNFGDEEILEKMALVVGKELGALTETERATLLAVASGLNPFCEAVNEAYAEDARLLEMAQSNLAVSTEELYQVNKRVSEMNQTFTAMVNSLGQGFLLFGRDGICSPVFSRACAHLLETEPGGKDISDILKVPAPKREAFKDWYTMMFEERLEFEELAQVGPKTLDDHSQKLHIELEFKPVRNAEGALELILMIATDRTEELNARRQAEENQVFANMVLMILRDKPQFRRFLQAGRDLVSDTVTVMKSRLPREELLARAQKNLHTLKAVAGTIHAARVHELVQKFETRVLAEHDLDLKLDLLGETVARIETEFDELTARLRDLLGNGESATREVPVTRLQEFAQELSAGGKSAQELMQLFNEKILSTPIEDIFLPYNEVVSQTAARLRKRVKQIAVEGDRVSIPREKFEPVWTSLTNVFRNIVDHGIEDPDTRAAKGKDADGQVRVQVRRLALVPDRAELEIKICDDGAGIDLNALREKLAIAGREDLAKNGSPAEVMNTIFEKGVSTAAKVTDISGMGIGLSSVKEAVQKCGGAIAVESQAGNGTVFILKLPLSA